MGKATRKKLEAEERAEQMWRARLAVDKNSGKTYRGVIRGADVVPKYVRRFAGRQINSYKDWTYAGKSKRKDKQQIALVRYMFAKYPVPRFLEEIFVSEDKSKFEKYGKWYLAAAQGDSLYKTCTRGILSKKESHWLLQAPQDLTLKEAIWWAKGVAITQNKGEAYRLARSTIGRRGIPTDDFWIDVHRFFMNNPVPGKEVQELLDYIQASRHDNPDWTIKKRSLQAVRRQSEVWHRDQVRMSKIGGGSWEGLEIPPWKTTTGKKNADPRKDTKTEWIIYEITTGNELAQEGNKMRHCVSSYKRYCMSGSRSIFTMRSNTILYDGRRHLTIEVDRGHGNPAVTQARGLANRPPKGKEAEVLRKWANENRITVRTNRHGW